MRTRNSRGRFSTPKMRARNEKGRFVPSPHMDVRTEKQVPDVEKLIRTSPVVTFILIHADWCGPCQMFKPTWKKLAHTPGRRANIVSVHHDMLEKIPTIAKAKIDGYPSVIKVEPSGAISEYVVPGTDKKTNVVPFMREEAKMAHELTAPAKNSGIPGAQAGIVNVQNVLKKEAEIAQRGGMTLLGSLAGALQQAGPAAVLMFANAMLPKPKRNVKTYKSPKRSSRRGSTRRNRV